ncbi:hypothetical protein EYF80_041793 [Liparis tanakae]|uniref:Uncharacterized protein n=1 Tax=Liparis tanakae TaxID=230148 RepID=A0A4Z2G3Y8_9TELE|nr:hypothetical protein EYF80_041793 [Liparis tanakae]
MSHDTQTLPVGSYLVLVRKWSRFPLLVLVREWSRFPLLVLVLQWSRFPLLVLVRVQLGLCGPKCAKLARRVPTHLHKRRVCSSTATRRIRPPSCSWIWSSRPGEQPPSSRGVMLPVRASTSERSRASGSCSRSPDGVPGVRFPEASPSGPSSAAGSGSSTSSVAGGGKGLILLVRVLGSGDLQVRGHHLIKALQLVATSSFTLVTERALLTLEIFGERIGRVFISLGVSALRSPTVLMFLARTSCPKPRHL